MAFLLKCNKRWVIIRFSSPEIGPSRFQSRLLPLWGLGRYGQTLAPKYQ